MMNKVSSTKLSEDLSNDRDFIELGDGLVNFISDIPNQEAFLANYNEENFKNGGEEYFLDLTGYKNEDVISSLEIINENRTNILEKYPELRYNGSNGEFIENVISEAYAKIDERQQTSARKRNLAACQACVKKWKPRMVWGTILGGISGGALGGINGGGNPWGLIWGSWAGAVAGFAGAGWGAVDCLEAAGC